MHLSGEFLKKKEAKITETNWTAESLHKATPAVWGCFSSITFFYDGEGHHCTVCPLGETFPREENVTKAHSTHTSCEQWVKCIWVNCSFATVWALISGVAVHNAVSCVLTGSPDPPGIGPASGSRLCRLGAVTSRPARSSCSTEAGEEKKVRVTPGSHLTRKRSSLRKWHASRRPPVHTRRTRVRDS